MAYFLDTACVLGLVLEDDEVHPSCIEWQMMAEGGFVTTDYVIWETVNSLSDHRVRAMAGALVDELRSGNDVEIIPASRDLMDAGLALFRSRPDKDWSLTDCISFVVMEERGMTDALTSDHHFEQAGFKALLRA